VQADHKTCSHSHHMPRKVKAHCGLRGAYLADSGLASGGHPHSTYECMNQLEDLGGDRQTTND